MEIHDGALVFDAAAGFSAGGRVWRPGAPLADQINDLHDHVVDLEGQLNGLVTRIDTEFVQLTAAIGQIRADLVATEDARRQELATKEKRAAQLDARGVPVVGFAILLTAVPDHLADGPLGIGWWSLAAGLVVSAWAAYTLVIENGG